MTIPRHYESRAVPGVIYYLEQSRAGSRKLHCLRMPERVDPANRAAGLGETIPLRAVPLHIRRAARMAIGLPPTRRGY